MKTHLPTAVLAALLATGAAAGDQAALSASASASLAAEPAEVWSYIGDFQDLTWHPAVHSQTGEGGNEVDATRTLVIGEDGGPTIEEVLTAYDDSGMSYSYRITDVTVEVLPVTSYSSELSVAPREGGGSTVDWSGTFERGDPSADPAPEANDEAAVAAVTGIYDAGMQALVEKFGTPGS